MTWYSNSCILHCHHVSLLADVSENKEVICVFSGVQKLTPMDGLTDSWDSGI